MSESSRKDSAKSLRGPEAEVQEAAQSVWDYCLLLQLTSYQGTFNLWQVDTTDGLLPAMIVIAAKGKPAPACFVPKGLATRQLSTLTKLPKELDDAEKARG